MLIIAKADIRPPTAPVLGTPTALSSSSISIPLTTPATDLQSVASYAIERATAAAGEYTVITSAATFPYVDTGRSASTTYYYRCRATDGSGNVGNYSAIVNATTQAASGGGAVIFRADFSNPNATGSNLYNFGTRSGTSAPSEGPPGPHGSYTHMPSGGPGGTPCVQIAQFPLHYQYPITYTTPTNSVDWGTGPGQQREIWYRAIFRVEAGSRFDFGSAGGKFIDHGGGGSNRTIIWMSASYGIGAGVSVIGDPLRADAFGNPMYSDNQFAIPSYFGLTGNSGSSWENNYNGRFGSIGCSRGTGPKACNPALITSMDNVLQPAPGPNSAAPVNGWYYVQVCVEFGNTPYNSSDVPNPTPYSRYRIWVNNNDLNNPTAIQYCWGQDFEGAPITGGADYRTGVAVGNYVGGGSGNNDPSKSFVWRLAGFEYGLTGRTDYYPG